MVIWSHGSKGDSSVAGYLGGRPSRQKEADGGFFYWELRQSMLTAFEFPKKSGSGNKVVG